MNYQKLTDEEALDILKTEHDSKTVEHFESKGEIISPPDVLYYADAYGDLEDAILLQGWDKTLSKYVHKGLLDSGLDIYEGVDVHDLDKEFCPCCDSEMYHFEISEPGGHTSYHTISEHGDIDDFLEYVSNPDGRYWNANPDENHSAMLCPVCSRDVQRDFPRHLDENGSVVAHYGETDEVSAFSVSGNLVKWEFQDRLGFRNSEQWTDLYPLPGDTLDLAESWATSNQTEFMQKHGWDEIAFSQVKEDLDAYASVHRRGSKKEYRKLAESWATEKETHPDLDFSYLIDFSMYGTPSFWVADENREALMAEITDLIERRN